MAWMLDHKACCTPQQRTPGLLVGRTASADLFPTLVQVWLCQLPRRFFSARVARCEVSDTWGGAAALMRVSSGGQWETDA
jgi:hypothetical protein